MALFPKWNITFLQFLHHLKAHKVPFSVALKHKSEFLQEIFLRGLRAPTGLFGHVGMHDDNPFFRKTLVDIY